MKIRLFVDAHVFDGTFQGTTTYLKGLYTHLVKDPDFEITLAANDLSKLKVHFHDERFKFAFLPGRNKWKRLLFDVPAILRNGRFNYAHFQYITPLKKECRYINTIHDLLFLDFPEYFPLGYRLKKRFLFGISARMSDIICTVSPYSMESIIRHFHIDKDKIIITPNAAEVRPFQDDKILKKDIPGKYLLYVSRFEPRKNHYLLLKTFVDLELYNKGFNLVFIGKRKDVPTIEFDNYYAEISETIRKHIFFYENISQDELTAFYKGAELFIYPSLAEGYGIPPIEAALQNCKVLCSNLTAMKSFDFFGKYLFDPHYPAELKLKLSEILSDPDYPYDSIRKDILDRYNWDTIAKDFGTQIKKDFYKIQ